MRERGETVTEKCESISQGKLHKNEYFFILVLSLMEIIPAHYIFIAVATLTLNTLDKRKCDK